VNALRKTWTLLRRASAATECSHSDGPLVGKRLQDIFPNGGTADPAADENSSEVVVAGHLSGSIACMGHAGDVHRKQRARRGQQDKVHKTSVMDSAIELYRFLSKDL
jgi:hypothetical protein